MKNESKNQKLGKLKMNDLKINSFITSLDSKTSKTIVGGRDSDTLSDHTDILGCISHEPCGGASGRCRTNVGACTDAPPSTPFNVCVPV